MTVAWPLPRTADGALGAEGVPAGVIADEVVAAEVPVEFVAVALKVFAKTNPSKLRDAARTVEIHARINDIECLGED